MPPRVAARSAQAACATRREACVANPSELRAGAIPRGLCPTRGLSLRRRITGATDNPAPRRMDASKARTPLSGAAVPNRRNRDQADNP